MPPCPRASLGARQKRVRAKSWTDDGKMSNWAKLMGKVASSSSSTPGGGGKKRPRPDHIGNGGGGGGGGGSGGKAPMPGGGFSGIPPPFTPPPGSSPLPALVEPSHSVFTPLMEQCFKGFVQQHASEVFAPSLERRVTDGLEELNQQGLFHHDVVTNGGIRLGATVVRRILAGEPGITYKYLGLRTFAHPWRGEGARPQLAPLQELNAAFVASTTRLLKVGKGVGKNGSCAYNLSLVNLLEPSDARGGALRNKAGEKLGTGGMAVSWHADSAVEDFSSIAVLNLTLPAPKGGGSGGGGGGRGAGKGGGKGVVGGGKGGRFGGKGGELDRKSTR